MGREKRTGEMILTALASVSSLYVLSFNYADDGNSGCVKDDCIFRVLFIVADAFVHIGLFLF